jgi:hypothetical protein
MRASIVIGASALLLVGCGTTAARRAPAQIDFAVQEEVLPHIGEPRVLARGVNPIEESAQKDGTLDGSRHVVPLSDGRSLVLWTEGSIYWGRRAFAQAFAADGAPRSARVALSSPQMDVFGVVGAVAVDGGRVVATFCAAEGNVFEMVAVPIEGL